MNKLIKHLICLSILAYSPLALSGASMKPTADLSIKEIRTSETEKYIYRAVLKASDSEQVLIIEKIKKGQTTVGNKLVSSSNCKSLKGGDKIKSGKGWNITDLNWGPAGLDFKNQMVLGSLIESIHCSINAYDNKPEVTCK